jgi:phosphoglucosamine mutase
MHVSFGTDGVRGVANRQITAELALALGRASVRVFGAPRVVVGRDTRRSGQLLEAAVVAGICAEGAEAVPLGVVPTPAVAHAVAAEPDSAGVMISASHNPFPDNGLKLFAPGGLKLDDPTQRRVEAELEVLLDGTVHPGPTGTATGTVSPSRRAVERYAESVCAAIEGRRLDGLYVVLDTANGSNSSIGPEVLHRLGAQVNVIADAPDGTNINHECGSTHPERLCEAVVAMGADVGVAFDGDADRLMAVDPSGSVVDGDQLLAICALDLQERGALHDDAVAVTVMSNLGFRQAMEAAGIEVVETRVGDRYVLEALEARGLSLGGEQSGHLIFRDLSTTGDGLLSAVFVLDVLVRSGRRIDELASVVVRYPQVLVNVEVASPRPDVAQQLAEEIAAAERDLGEHGRVLLRPSGTEPLVRVMVEAPTEAEARRVASHLAEDVRHLAAN